MIDVLQTVKAKPPAQVTSDDARLRLERLVAVTRSGRRQYAPRQPN